MMILNYQHKLPYNIMTLENLKIKNMEELILLSGKCKGYLNKVFVNEKNKIEKFVRTFKYGATCNDNYYKLLIIMNSLNEEQKGVFDKIHEHLSVENGSISCIDANPGTGKTFLIACILMTYKYNASYIVYTNKLKECMDLIYFDGESSTCCKFLMNILSINYYKAKYFWNNKYPTLDEKCQEIENVVQKIKPVYKLYILDEYSVVSPFFIYFMFCMYKIHKVHIILVGDRHQLMSMNCSKFHNINNYHLIASISKIYNMQINVRQQNDNKFQLLLKNFMAFYKQTNKMNFAVKYFIYKELRSYFTATDNYDALYFAQYHVKLKKRLDNYEKYLITNKIHYVLAQLTTKKIIDKKSDVVFSSALRKFNPYLILVRNKKYIYTPNNKVNYLVELLKINENNLEVKNLTNNRHMFISRVPINTNFMSEQLLDHVHEMNMGTLYQYPLRELISTYHAAQGLTITDAKIELDIDCQYINSFFVGLTRIRSLDQLVKIHSADLLSFYYTAFMDDNYYYKINTKVNALTNLFFVNCTSHYVFEHSNRNLKIPKLVYEKLNNTKDNKSELINYITTKYNF
ncbi:helicase 2 [Macrobrachium rosenbergii nudivirus]|nr:helicase 2 [Macrobrachium rosenbergii nudivirus]